MIRHAYSLLVIIVIGLVQNAFAEPQVELNKERCAKWEPKSSSCIAIRASIINLIATPERFDKKAIQTTGYLQLEFEHAALYLNKDSTQDEGLWVGIDIGQRESTTEWTKADVEKWYKQNNTWRCKFNNQRVIVQGTFHMEPAGHLIAEFPGSIVISEIKPMSGKEKQCK